jgi:hypothetical protein
MIRPTSPVKVSDKLSVEVVVGHKSRIKLSKTLGTDEDFNSSAFDGNVLAFYNHETGVAVVKCDTLWEAVKGNYDEFVNRFAISTSHETIHFLIANTLEPYEHPRQKLGEETVVRALSYGRSLLAETNGMMIASNEELKYMLRMQLQFHKMNQMVMSLITVANSFVICLIISSVLFKPIQLWIPFTGAAITALVMTARNLMNRK